MLRIEHLTKVYPNGTRALDDLSLAVRDGEFLVVVGLSGSGKSTLLRCVNRLIEPTAGRIWLDDLEITGASAAALRRIRLQIGMIFQQFNLVRRQSVLTNVLSGRLGYVGTLPSLLGRFPGADLERARHNLARVGILEKARQRADTLSGGQQQRVAVARALMQEPKLMLADEPVASLDPATSHSVMRYLEEINREDGITVIANLHFLSLARRYATRVVALNAGRVVFDGLPTEIDEARFREIYGQDAVEVEIR
ncbi:MAG TPA: phosphonate ABC transporter ATP-binding protein [Chloroflexota bacterium]|jgi:phosphonate transport system ATP-binding protein|nr:phosphonate ABC transporter ATP-binding protein [Chloroflexota bacterium]